MPSRTDPGARSAWVRRAQAAAFKERETALKNRDLELQESLVRFSKFLQVRSNSHPVAFVMSCTVHLSSFLRRQR